MKTSIALCTYNGEAFLQEQLDSYLSQSQLPDELVVFDDCSTDNTLILLNEFKASAPFQVEIIQNQKQIGPALNFLNCLQRTTGELIFFSDQDDIWRIDKIEQFKTIFEADQQVQFAFSNANLINDNGEVIQQDFLHSIDFHKKWNPHQKLYQSMMKNHGFINGFLQVLRGEFRDQINSFREKNPSYQIRFGHDHVVAALAGLWYEDTQVQIIQEELVSYRQHDGQAIGAKQSMIGKDKVNEIVNTKRLAKTKHYESYTIYLNYYAELVGLAKPNHPIREELNEAVEFVALRSAISNASIFSKIAFAFHSFFSRKYKRFTQYPFKEFVRDVL